MKNYPKSLADVEALQSVLRFLYEHAESLDRDAAQYKERSEDAEESEFSREYNLDQFDEYSSKSAACIRLAERLAK